MDIKVRKVKHDNNSVPGGLTWLFIGQPKTWKTSAASRWSKNGQKGVLVIDTDLGADFVDGANVVTVTSLNPPKVAKTVDGKKVMKNGKQVIEIVPPEERGYFYRSSGSAGKPMPVYSLLEVYNSLSNGGLTYDTIVLDTINQVNEWIEEKVVTELGFSAMGEAGYAQDYIKARKNNLDLVKRLQKLVKKMGKTLILLSHSKMSTMEDGKVQLLPDVPRGLGYALAAKADVIGYTTVNKDDGNAYVSFRSYDERAVGSRLRALSNKELLFSYEAVTEEITKYKEDKPNGK